MKDELNEDDIEDELDNKIENKYKKTEVEAELDDCDHNDCDAVEKTFYWSLVDHQEKLIQI